MRPERVLVLGCGSVAQCTLPLLIRDLGDRSAAHHDRRHASTTAPASPIRSPRGVTYRAGSGHAREPRRVPLGASRPGRPAARPGVEHRQPDDPAMVPRPRRALPQHQRRGVGSVRRSGIDASARPHAVRAPHGHPPDDRPVGRQHGRDRRARARRQPRPRQPLHQAGPHRDRRGACCSDGLAADRGGAGAGAWPTRTTRRWRC